MSLAWRHCRLSVVAATLIVASVGTVGHAGSQDFVDFAFVSSTMGISSSRLCLGEPNSTSSHTVALGCPSYAPSITANGDISVTGNVSANKFIGDGSGLTGVAAASSDRIVSGTSNATSMVAVSSTGYISVTQAGANSAWFDPTKGLVTLGVSSTGGISGSTGYFSGNVGIGTNAPQRKLDVLGDYARLRGNGGITTGFILNNYDGSDTSWFLQSLGSSALGSGWGPNKGFAIDEGGGVPRFVIAPGGNVGIGTTAPQATLTVGGGSTAFVNIGQLSNSNSTYAGIAFTTAASAAVTGSNYSLLGDGSNSYISAPTGAVAFRVGNTDKMRLTSTGGLALGATYSASNDPGANNAIIQGNVGIGTTSPAKTLDVSGTANITSNTFIGGNATPSTTLDVSGTLRVAGTGAETCGAGKYGMIRRDPVTGWMQMCRE